MMILASQSPRRSELLTMLGIEHEVIPAHIEELLVDGESPAESVERLAGEKALSVAALHPGVGVVGADTVVVIDGIVFGKPGLPAEAERMLRTLSGREHEVVTGVAIAIDGELHSAHERTFVRFRQLSETMISEYVATGEPLDKAGSYGIQGYGAVIVERIDGDYFCVMGLPLGLLTVLMEKAGMPYHFTR